MSVPRVLLIPTHRTGLADGLAAASVEILTSQGREARYHHVGPSAPMSSWDRSGGAVFLDPALTGEDAALDLYEVAVRHADVSILSSTDGLLDHREGIDWVPADFAGLLDCPTVVIMDCRGWGSGIRLLATGIKSRMRPVDLAGVILTGVTDKEHYESLKWVLSDEGLRVVGCLYEGQGLDWDSAPPGPWGLPLPAELLEAVAQQMDVDGLMTIASQRGFLATHKRLSDHSKEGPLILVADGRGFTQWSRDSLELLRSAGAQVRRLELLEDAPLHPEAAGLILAGTFWPESVQDISMNTTLLGDIADKVGRRGMPTLALGGGMLLMLAGAQDTLGRSSEFAGVIPARGEILWDLETPAYVEVESVRENVLLAEGEKAMGWALSEIELTAVGQAWEPPLVLRGIGSVTDRGESFGSSSLLCSPALIHLAAVRGAASRFVRRCEAFASSQESEG